MIVSICTGSRRVSLLGGVMVAGAILLAAPALAVLTFNQNFDSGSLNVGATTVDYTNPVSPVVSMVPRYTYAKVPPMWGWLYFQANGVQGLKPTFKDPGALNGGGVTSIPGSMRYVYSYDQQTWFDFDNGSTDAAGKHSSSNNSAFTQNTVYVAMCIPYTMARTDAFVASLTSNPWVKPTSTANANLVIGRTLGTAGGGYLDDLGRQVAAQNLYGFKITDTAATGPKQKIVLMSGNHGSETAGQYGLEGLVQWLISSDSKAAALRQQADFYVYPQVAPEAQAAGYYRSCPQHPDNNHNRWWDNPSGFTDISIVENSMKADTGTLANYFFDFHVGSFVEHEIIINPDMDNSAFVNHLYARQPAIHEYVYAEAITDSDGWASSTLGLNALYSSTVEFGSLPGWTITDYQNLGKSYGLAMYDTLVVPEPACLGLLSLAGLALLGRRRA